MLNYQRENRRVNNPTVAALKSYKGDCNSWYSCNQGDKGYVPLKWCHKPAITVKGYSYNDHPIMWAIQSYKRTSHGFWHTLKPSDGFRVSHFQKRRDENPPVGPCRMSSQGQKNHHVEGPWSPVGPGISRAHVGKDWEAHENPGHGMSHGFIATCRCGSKGEKSL